MDFFITLAIEKMIKDQVSTVGKLEGLLVIISHKCDCFQTLAPVLVTSFHDGSHKDRLISVVIGGQKIDEEGWEVQILPPQLGTLNKSNIHGPE